MWIHPRRLALVAGLIVLPSAAIADKPAAAEFATRPPAVGAPPPSWDGSHMRSNHWNRDTTPVTRPAIQGASGYGAMAAGTATPTKLEVDRKLEATTQREWQQGPLAPNTRQPARQASSEPTSPRGVNSGITRGSKLRANASSRRRR